MLSDKKRVENNYGWVIYIFRCPDTNKVRYVGWTVDLLNRLSVHKARAKNPKTYCEKWVAKLIRENKLPIIEIVESGFGDSWINCEQKWIKRFRDLGEPLTNLTDGGEGFVGYKHTPETLEKMRRCRLGLKQSEKTKELRRQKLLGRVFTKEWKTKISKTKLERKGTRGNKLTEEHKRKISSSLKGRKPNIKITHATKEVADQNCMKALPWKPRPPKKIKILKGMPRGEQRPNSKLNDEKVRLIRKLKLEGKNITTISKIVNIDRSAVSRVISGEVWNHVK